MVDMGKDNSMKIEGYVGKNVEIQRESERVTVWYDS